MEVSFDDQRVTIDETLVQAKKVIIRQLVKEYANGEQKAIDLDVTFPDSFLGEVMESMASIPYGETRTYGQLADRLDTAAVAVGQACGRNPVPVIVPCHRVVARDGIGGYQYPGLKERLLGLEERNSNRS